MLNFLSSKLPFFLLFPAGTYEFASERQLEQRILGPADDLESLGYALLELYVGHSWRYVQHFYTFSFYFFVHKVTIIFTLLLLFYYAAAAVRFLRNLKTRNSSNLLKKINIWSSLLDAAATTTTITSETESHLQHKLN